jgi:hypothetical protein
VQRLRAENAELRQESPQLPDLQSVRDRILKTWKVQRRAESKERILEALDKFIKELLEQ